MIRNAQLWQFLKDEGITLDEVSQKTGYSLMYLLNMLKGHEVLNDKAKFRFIQAFPETANFLLEQTAGKPETK